MGASYSSAIGIPESCLDFSFGFDDRTYSDRTLLLYIADHHLPTDTNATTVPPRVKVKTMYINSLILAARSPFFRKLFSNGMQESRKNLVTLRIETAEEASLVNLLKYVYSNNMPTTLHALLDLLVIADKFEVASCLRDCTRLLQNMPMTCESASLCLNLPPSLLMSPAVQPLLDVAKQFLVAHFKDFDRYKKEMLTLPLASLQVVISSDDLQVTSEDVVYDSVLTWLHKHYKDPEERRGILKTHLLDLIRFPFMTVSQLTEKVQTCSDIDRELASRIVISSLRFKVDRKCCLVAEGTDVSRQFVKRAYKYLPIKVVELEPPPHHDCLVFLQLTWKELEHIYPDREITSEIFHLGEQQLVFVGRFVFHQQTNKHYFSLVLKVVGSAATFTVKHETAVRKRPSKEFVSRNKGKGKHTFTEQKSTGQVVSLWWSDLTSADSTYFINDVMHVRTQLTIEK